MSQAGEPGLVPVLWMEDQPERLERDLRELAEFAPDLVYAAPGSDPALRHGGWVGRLPVWPFARPEPDGVIDLIGGEGMPIAVICSSAHPVIPPTIHPIEPEPTFIERTQHRWHVAPNGSLCLLQTQGQWAPEASITELLEKAAGWRIEYALMKADAIEDMTVNGIASDGSLDALIAETAARQVSETTAPDDDAGAAQEEIGTAETAANGDADDHNQATDL